MNRIVWGLLSVLVFFLVYYLFVKPFEYDVKFKSNTLPGDLIETIRIWNKSLDTGRIVEVDSFFTLLQTVDIENRKYSLVWNFKTSNDSATFVTVQVSESGKSLLNKLLIPITDQPIERDIGKLVQEFYDVLKIHLKITKVKIVGEITLDSTFCLCSSVETTQTDKAYGMMRDFPLLTSFIQEFNLTPSGVPVIRIRDWSHSRGTLKYDFCFPIVRKGTLPVYDLFFYTYVGGMKVLKAEYYGNYITSDRAWYELINYANKNGYDVAGFPLEYFHNNPNLGINESEWKADIYLPVLSQSNN
ncbi:MAG: GyrI-like domain-containing protein [Cyclobacteriaceae bacterium]|nr:GyrI-like domain-containing protein [Cyclobacteriaceae bacterium]